jgi:hypothetical protein
MREYSSSNSTPTKSAPRNIRAITTVDAPHPDPKSSTRLPANHVAGA